MLFFLAGLVAVVGDFFIPFILGKKYPDYSNLNDTISTLGIANSPVKKQLSYLLITTGSLILIFSVGHMCIFSLNSWKHILYIWGIILFGMGSILAGIFPEDAKGKKETISGKIHGIGSGLGFISLIFNPLWMFLIIDNNNLRLFNILFFLLGLISFVFFITSYKRSKGGLTGLWQRINLASIYLPLIVNYSFFAFID